MVVRGVESDGREVGELRLEDFLCLAEHDVTASTLRHAAKDHHVVDCVEFLVLGKSVAHVHTDGLVDLAHLRLLLRVRHCLLDQLQTLRVALVLDGERVRVTKNHVLRQTLDTSLGRKARATALAQVHMRAAGVHTTVPRIPDGLGIEIDPDVGHLVAPAQEVAICVGVATTRCAPKRDAKDISGANLLSGSHGSDLTVIDDFQGHIPSQCLGKPREDVHDLLLVHIRRHIGEEVAPRRLVFGRDGAGGTASNRVHLSIWQ
mmetsp:Transcript_69354/g.160688  ORF Transcript_69354/g.160688 Transcript_69354/m.160688 type:complete len:261 (+) Transcript_69354:143-925(+)